MEHEVTATEEQVAYAKLLDAGMKLGLLALILTFIIYVAGIFTPHIAVSDLPKYWGLSVHKYLEATGIQPGWAWVGLIGNGRFPQLRRDCVPRGHISPLLSEDHTDFLQQEGLLVWNTRHCGSRGPGSRGIGYTQGRRTLI